MLEYSYNSLNSSWNSFIWS